MNRIEQVQENIASAEKAFPNILDKDESNFIEQVRSELNKRTIIPCTKCNYCMPCPQGVIIPWNLEQYNEGVIYGDPGSPRFVYNTFMKPENRASACINCKLCEKRCPQQIKISEWMPKIKAVLGENQPYPI
jgi:predicted aldo/keto reductase-like oxidoreductase